MQMRQAHEISLSQAYQSRTTTAAEWNNALASNEVALSALRKAKEGRDEEISHEEYDALVRVIASVLYLYDNAHFQYQNGFVSEEFWLTTRASVKSFIAPPAINAIVMDRLSVQGREEFKSVVRVISEELHAEDESP